MQLPCRRLRRPRRVLRHGRAASCPAAMAPWQRCLSTAHARDASATAAVATTVSASIKDSCLVPSCPASRQKVSRGCRPAASDAAWPPVKAARILDSPPPVRARGAIRAKCRCISPATPECASIPETAPGRRCMPAAAPNAGFPPAVRSPGLPESPPAMPHKSGFKDGFRIASGTKAAPAPRSYQPAPPLRSRPV